jgi:hypothetical protein
MESAAIEEVLTASESFYNDDDVKQTAEESIVIEKPSMEEARNNLFNTTSSFIGQLTNILSDASATESLVQSLTRKDEHSGQTYLQIPVENEAVIKNAIALLAGLFKKN